MCNIKIPVLLGSATPDITTFYEAQQGNIELLKLTKRANNSNLPSIQVVDLKQELANGNRTMISVKLYKLIEENLKNKKQTILFLNRRGFSTFIMCRDCGYVAKCRNCNISLTYHKKEEKLKCHYCGYEEPLAKICPNCGSKKIRHFGTGTQKLELEINKLFPKASTIRMDIRHRKTEASAVRYVVTGGRKIAIVSATEIERFLSFYTESPEGETGSIKDPAGRGMEERTEACEEEQ